MPVEVVGGACGGCGRGLWRLWTEPVVWRLWADPVEAVGEARNLLSAGSPSPQGILKGLPGSVPQKWNPRHPAAVYSSR